MAVDVCSTTSEASTTPRISFSNDLNDTSSEPIRSDSSEPIRSDQFLLSPSFKFEFCSISNLTPADELFSNGKILPTQIKKPQKIQTHDPKTEILTSLNQNADTQHQEQDKTRSFWQFRRSSSLNCDSIKGPKGLLRSLSIKSLSRSNSTGSALNPKRNICPKVVEKSKEPGSLRRCKSLNQPQPPSVHTYYTYQHSNNLRNCKGGIRITPVLNIPPSVNFFGFGSLFCIGKGKRKTRS